MTFSIVDSDTRYNLSREGLMHVVRVSIGGSSVILPFFLGDNQVIVILSKLLFVFIQDAHFLICSSDNDSVAQ
jgi:hypothetical protein